MLDTGVFQNPVSRACFRRNLQLVLNTDGFVGLSLSVSAAAIPKSLEPYTLALDCETFNLGPPMQ